MNVFKVFEISRLKSSILKLKHDLIFEMNRNTINVIKSQIKAHKNAIKELKN